MSAWLICKSINFYLLAVATAHDDDDEIENVVLICGYSQIKEAN